MQDNGIEIFPEYITPLHKLIYDTILTGDACDIVKLLLGPYDLLLCVDMLEHLTRDKAFDLLREFKRIARNSIVAIPVHTGSQDVAAYGNIHEIHRSSFDFAELSQFGNCFVFEDDMYILEIEDR